jgi:hypothetical protein
MNIFRADIKSAKKPMDEGDDFTGLAWPRTWRGVYWFVFACFILSVLLLLVLTIAYS